VDLHPEIEGLDVCHPVVDRSCPAYDALEAAGNQWMTAPRLIVCERTTRWAIALRAALAGPPRLVETRSLSQCAAELAQSPASLAAVETTGANLGLVLELLDHMSQRFPRARAVALIEPELLPAAVLLREAQAIDVLAWAHEAPRVARLARRQFDLAPRRQLGLHELVAQRMPWAAYTAAGG
jgi:hypothetical protein